MIFSDGAFKQITEELKGKKDLMEQFDKEQKDLKNSLGSIDDRFDKELARQSSLKIHCFDLSQEEEQK